MRQTATDVRHPLNTIMPARQWTFLINMICQQVRDPLHHLLHHKPSQVIALHQNNVSTLLARGTNKSAATTTSHLPEPMPPSQLKYRYRNQEEAHKVSEFHNLVGHLRQLSLLLSRVNVVDIVMRE